MSAALRYIYIDSTAGFCEVGSYTIAGQLRIVYVAPLPHLALVITPGYPLDYFLDQTVGIYLGWAERRQPQEQHAWGHFPELFQSKITIVASFTNQQARRTLSEVLVDSPKAPLVVTGSD